MAKHTLLGIFLAFASVNVWATGSGYKVKVFDDHNQIRIHFDTQKTYSSMCHLRITQLDLSSANVIPALDSVKPSVGLIDISAEIAHSAPCFQATGPHFGTATFERGSGLPHLGVGSYQLKINDIDVGMLVVERDSAFLE